MKEERRQITIHVQRFVPGRDTTPRMETFQVEAATSQRVVDVLRKIKEEQDDTLSWRSSCEHGICGSDGMNINGRNTLACQILVGNLPHDITIKPLPGLRVIKDLVNDQSELFEKYKRVKPWLIPRNDPPAPDRERVQLPSEYEVYEPYTRCILCFCCSSACPSTRRGDELTPAIIMGGLKQCLDSRDGGLEERREILQGETGTLRCRTFWECTASCPKDIPIAQAVARAKRI